MNKSSKRDLTTLIVAVIVVGVLLYMILTADLWPYEETWLGRYYNYVEKCEGEK